MDGSFPTVTQQHYEQNGATARRSRRSSRSWLCNSEGPLTCMLVKRLSEPWNPPVQYLTSLRLLSWERKKKDCPESKSKQRWEQCGSINPKEFQGEQSWTLSNLNAESFQPCGSMMAWFCLTFIRSDITVADTLKNNHSIHWNRNLAHTRLKSDFIPPDHIQLSTTESVYFFMPRGFKLIL